MSDHSFASVSGSLAEQLARIQSALAKAEQRNHELRRALDEATATAQLATERLATFTSYLQEGVLLVDPRGTIALINDYCCNLFGLPLPASNWLGYSVQNVANWLQEQAADPAAFQQQVQTRWQGGRPVLGQELEMHDGRLLEWDYIPTSETAASAVASIGFLLCLRDVTEQRRREQQLAHDRAFYELILSQLPGEVFVTDPTYHYQFVNAQAAREPALREWMIGRTNAEYNAHQGYAPEVSQQWQAHFEQAVATRTLVQWTETVPGPESPRHVVRQLQPVVDEAGQVQSVIGYGLDVTEQEETRQQFRQQRTFYEAILSNIPADIAVFDAAQRYRYVNHQAVRNAEVREWLIGKDDFEYVAHRQLSRAIAEQRRYRFDEAVRQRRQMTWEETLARPDGTLGHYLRIFFPVFAADGTLEMVIGYGTDITSRRQAEDRIRASENRTRALFMALPDTILVTSRTGFVHDAKLGDDPLLSRAEDQLIGNHVADVLPQGAAEPVLASMDETVRTGRRAECSFDLLQPDGSRLHYRGRCAVLDAEELLLVLTHVSASPVPAGSRAALNP